MRGLLLVVTLLFLVAPARGEEEGDVDPIDQALTQCLDTPEGQSTQGMVECLDKAYQAWDKALNEVYGTLMTSLAPAPRDLLKKSQRQWISFRDSERAFLAALETANAGTIWRVTTNQALVDLVKARVLALRSYGPMGEE
jgi:uncharacterized protein YecT (DUF1311 family)